MIRWEVIQGDCLEVMAGLPTVDACITDPPYGTTACSWDSVIPFGPMWAHLKRIVKPSGAICLFGSQPFTSALVMSNPGMFKYETIWKKPRATGHLNAQVMPMREHENVLLFGEGKITYNPQIEAKPVANIRPVGVRAMTDSYGAFDPAAERLIPLDMAFPRSVLEFSNCNHGEWNGHPTQKPVDLMRYLVCTYTNPGETVLDFTCGSGTTGVACAIEGRNFIGIEQDAHYCKVAQARITRACGQYAEIPKRPAPETHLPLFAEVAA